MATRTNAWISYVEQLLYRGVGVAPHPSKFYLCASASAALTRASGFADFIRAELKPEFGYQRQQVLWSGNGTYSNTNQRHELPTVTTTWTAASGTLQFQTVFLLANAHSKASESFAPSNVSGSTITIAGNLLANGDTVIPVADAGSTLPGNLVSNTAYTAINVNSGTGAFQFSSDGVNPITLSNAGSGTFQLRYATGVVVLLQVEANAVSLQTGRPVQYDIDLVGMNAAYGSGV
jgi:hypothetical protein